VRCVKKLPLRDWDRAEGARAGIVKTGFQTPKPKQRKRCTLFYERQFQQKQIFQRTIVSCS
jgi:hypothetical protein